jgi:speckle-type POZ protein
MSGAMLLDTDYGFSVNDSVVFKVEIIVFGDLEATSFPLVSTVNSNILIPSLSRSLKQLLSSGDIADVVIDVGGVHLSAHRCILSARSPVFHAMLKNEMTERVTGTISIDDVDPQVMQECLTFMYTDECSDSMVSQLIFNLILCLDMGERTVIYLHYNSTLIVNRSWT